MEQEISEAAERYAAATAVPVDDPLSALLRVAGEVLSFKDFIGRRVADLRADQWRYHGAFAEQLRAEISVYERAMDRAAKVLAEINRLGLEERQTRLAEREGALIADAIRKILAELDLSVEQQARVPELVPRILRSVADQEAS
jgi:hypothetical protein